MSILTTILLHGLTHGSRTAVIDDQRRYTYRQILGGSMFLAEAITAASQAKNIGLLLPTSGATAMSILGCWLARRTAVPLNFLLSPEELHFIIADSDIDTLFTVGPMLEYLGGAERIPKGIQIIKLEDLDFTGMPPFRWPPCLRDEELAVILYTSGTSGRPKGVMLSHGNLHSDLKMAIQHAGLTEADTFLGVLPQFHSFGLTALTLLPLYMGSTVVYTARFIPRRIVELIEKHKPDIFMAVPSMYGALLSVKSADADSYASIRIPISGGEPLPEAVYEEFLERFNLRLLEGYGLTETSPISHWSTPRMFKHKAVGQALPGVVVRILDEQDRPLPANSDGEIVLHGPNIMQGYYKQPELTASVMMNLTEPGPDGEPITRTFFRTGDIGRVDEQGFLMITGRKKEMLIIAGENVFPREIEEVLNMHPAVKDAAVIGKRDDLRGELPVAFIELHEGQTVEEGVLRKWAGERLAQFKVPREIHIVEALPRNPTGKILRRKLQA